MSTSPMEFFDNAVHYGPNDAGVSTLTISLGVLSIILGLWVISAAYEFIEKLIKNKHQNK